MAAGAVEGVAGRWRREGDGDVLRLLLPLLFDFNRRRKMGGFGNGRRGAVGFLAVRRGGNGGRSCGRRSREATVSLGMIVVEVLWRLRAGIKVQRRRDGAV